MDIDGIDGIDNFAPTDLFFLDVLPVEAGIETLMGQTQDGRTVLKFRASKRTRWLRRKVYSDWSGTFVFTGEPIALTWQAFWA